MQRLGKVYIVLNDVKSSSVLAVELRLLMIEFFFYLVALIDYVSILYFGHSLFVKHHC